MTPVSVKKKSGISEDFSEQKLIKSLVYAGSGREAAEEIVAKLKKKLYPNITTAQIYQLAFSQLQKTSKHFAANYSLKKAILGFGPSGYFFEKFVAAIYSELGYETEISKTLKGRCISHEIDVVAKKDGLTYFMECKFHNSPNKKNDVKTALYVHARSLDLKEGSNTPYHEDFFLVSNSVFSKDAITYANCVGLRLIGLNSPDENNLHAIIRKFKLHPITCLKKLRIKDKEHLMEAGVMLCREVMAAPQILNKIGLGPSEKRSVLNEIRNILLGPATEKTVSIQ